MHSRLSQHLHTNNILVILQYGFRKGMSTKDAAFRLTDSLSKFINLKKKKSEEFSLIWQRLVIACIMKFC